MDPTQPGVPLVGGVVCFPSDWSMHEKIGLPFLDVHGPVPGFAASIGKPSVDLLERLKVGRPVWRPNWVGIKPCDQLNLTPDQGPAVNVLKRTITVDTVAAHVYFRVERQTLCRLPKTQHVLFTIRTYIEPITEIVKRPDWRRNLRGWLTSAPPEWLAYKGFEPFLAPVLAWMDS
jgi:hypothetical protein